MSTSANILPVTRGLVESPPEWNTARVVITLEEEVLNPQRKATLLGLSAVFFWSTVATAFKMALRHVDHFQLLLLANVFSLVSLGAVLVFRKKSHLLLCATGRQYRLSLSLIHISEPTRRACRSRMPSSA